MVCVVLLLCDSMFGMCGVQGQTALDQVTEMLKLTKETLGNSSDGQRCAKLAEKSDSAQCLEAIAKLLMSHMPQGEGERETISSTPSNNRDYLMTEGASASQSQSPKEGANHVPVRKAPVDRTGRGALEDEGGTTQPRPLNRSGSFTSYHPSPDMTQPLASKKRSPPALVFVDSPDEDEDTTGLLGSKTVVDGWLEEDTRDVSRKRHRERLPSTGVSSQSKRPRASGGESRPQRATALRQGSLRHYPSGRGLICRDSSEQLANEGTDISCDLVAEQPSPHSGIIPPQPMLTSPHSQDPIRDSVPGPALLPSTAHMRVRVTIEGTTFLIPCPVATSPSLSFAWLADEASHRYSLQTGRRPRLSLTTRDGAQLCLEDLLADILGHNEEVVGVVMGWDLPPLAERYKAHCKKVGQGEDLHAT